METFAQYLKALIDVSGISIRSISEQSGLERTSLHKILSGERPCPDGETVERLAKVLMLDTKQTKLLREKGLIAKMGPGVYARHQHVKSLLESFDISVLPHGLWSKSTDPALLEFEGDAMPIQGVEKVNRYVKTVVELEADRAGGTIRVIAQPEYTFLTNLLSHIGQSKRELTIIHIVCMQRNVSEQGDNHINLEIMSSLVPLITSVCSYQPFFYYDDVQAHINELSMLPYMILTGDYAVAVASDASAAVLYRSKALRDFYSTQYNRFMESAAEALTQVQNPMSLFMGFQSPMSLEDLPGYSIAVEPCLASFVSEHYINKYMLDSFGEKQAVIDWFGSITESAGLMRRAECIRVSYFYEEGIEQFVQSGRVRELPEDYYSPIDKPDAYRLLRAMYELSRSGRYRPAIVKKDKFKVPRNLVMGLPSKHCVTLVYLREDRGMMISSIYERSFVKAISSFLVYLKDSEYVYTVKQTQDIILQKLNALEEELNLTPAERVTKHS